MPTIHAPRDNILPEHTEYPIIFLAGPIAGAPNWQEQAAQQILKNEPDIVVCSPRRRHEDKVTGRLTEEQYKEQVEWESIHLEAAAHKGAILFWLAKEEETIEGRSYAQTTRYELAEWLTRVEYTGTSLVVGIESGFSGARYLKTRHPSRYFPDNLEHTCRLVVDYAIRK